MAAISKFEPISTKFGEVISRLSETSCTEYHCGGMVTSLGLRPLVNLNIKSDDTYIWDILLYLTRNFTKIKTSAFSLNSVLCTKIHLVWVNITYLVYGMLQIVR